MMRLKLAATFVLLPTLAFAQNHIKRTNPSTYATESGAGAGHS